MCNAIEIEIGKRKEEALQVREFEPIKLSSNQAKTSRNYGGTKNITTIKSIYAELFFKEKIC